MPIMDKDKLIAYFGDVRKTATAFNLTTQAIYAWSNPVSEAVALKAEKLSGGKLKYRESDYN
jgi:hypothetical protein